MVATIDSAMMADIETQSAWRSLQMLVIAAGVGSSIVYIIAGVFSELQMFGDGSIFSYAVAAESAWSFHWHNISGRLFTYVYAYIPAEAFVALTKSAKGGIVVYGLLFFAAPMLGLLVTLAADRTSEPRDLRIRLSVDRVPLPAGLRRTDRNVDGACRVLAGACCLPLRSGQFAWHGRRVRRTAGAHIHA